MQNSSQSSSGGIGFFGLLGIVFIVLKLTKVINWSWIWVLSPFWIFPIIYIILFIIIVSLAKTKHKQQKSMWQQRVEELKKK